MLVRTPVDDEERALIERHNALRAVGSKIPHVPAWRAVEQSTDVSWLFRISTGEGVELRFGPFGTIGKPLAIVKMADGRREVIDFPDEGDYLIVVMKIRSKRRDGWWGAAGDFYADLDGGAAGAGHPRHQKGKP